MRREWLYVLIYLRDIFVAGKGNLFIALNLKKTDLALINLTTANVIRTLASFEIGPFIEVNASDIRILNPL